MANTTKNEIVALLKEVKREGMENLIDFLERTDFYTAPASTKFHNSNGINRFKVFFYRRYFFTI